MEEEYSYPSELGSVHIADEVVSIIAGLAALEVDGVAGMSGGIVGGIAEALGRKNLSRGVKVEGDEKEVSVDLYMSVNYGSRIHIVGRTVQEKVKKDIENMTGLKVKIVNLYVQGVSFSQENSEGKE